VGLTEKGERVLEKMRSERTDQLSMELGALGDVARRRLLEALPVLEALADSLKNRGPIDAAETRAGPRRSR
jgi:DNA-binding MarR family transcriptional regulator